MAFSNYLSLRASQLTALNTVNFTGSTITAGSTINTTSLFYSTMRGSTITVSTLTGSTLSGSSMTVSSITASGLVLSTLTVSSINNAVPGTGAGVSAFSTLTVSSIVSVSSIQTASTMYTSSMITTGRVGIGSAAPSVALDIVGTTKAGSTKQGGIIFGDLNRGVTYSGTGVFSGTAVFASSFPTDGPVIYGWVDGALGTTGGSGNNIALSWLYTGQVGIGITNPAFSLSVKNTQAIYGTGALGSTAAAAGNLLFYTSGDSNAYPTLNFFQYDHNNCGILFDMYFGSGWFNATTGTGYGIHKNSNLLQFTYVTGTAGANATLKTAMTLAPSGYLGIGTSAPTNPLTIVGSTTIQGYSFYVGGNASTFYPVFIDTSPSWETTNTYRFNISRSIVHLDSSWKGGTTIIVEGHNYSWGNGSDFLKYKIVAAGGTYSNFVANIVEDGTTQFVVIYLRGATTYYFSGQGCLLNNANASGTSLTISGGQNVMYAPTTTITTNFGSYSASGDNRDNIWTMNGNVGIGTANPSSLLHVNGAINCTSFLVNGTAVATGTGSVWGVNGASAYYTSGYVGIGTISPSANCHIHNTSGDRHTSLKVTTMRAGLWLESTGSGGSYWNMWSVLNGENPSAGSLAFYSTAGFAMTLTPGGVLRLGNSTSAVGINLFDLPAASWQITTGSYNLSINNNSDSWTNRVTITQTGSVGIGMTNPGYALDVTGSTRASGSLIFGASGAYVAGCIYSDANWGCILRARTTNPTTAAFLFSNSADTHLMAITNAGNVGIGTDMPSDILHLYTSGASANIGMVTQNGSRIWRAGVRGDTSSSYVIQDDTASAIRLVINSSGNVGIGTNTPGYLLHVNGSFNCTSLFVNGSAFTGSGSVWSLNGTSAYYNAGNVGIGTSSPAYPLSIVGAQSINGTSSQYSKTTTSGNLLFNTSSDSNAYPTMNLFNFDHNNNGIFFDIIYTSPNWQNCYTGTNWGIYKSGGILQFAYLNGTAGTTGGLTNMMVLTSTGVGIGTSNPLSPLMIQSPAIAVGGSVRGQIVIQTAEATPITRVSLGYDTSYNYLQGWNSLPLSINPLGNNVGIGITNPTSLLHVAGAINCTSFLVNGVAVATGTGSVWGVNGSSAYYTSGNVGIGTTAPTYPITTSTTGGTGLEVNRTGASTNYGVGMIHSLTSSPGSFRGEYAWTLGGATTIATSAQSQAYGYYCIDLANAGVFAANTGGYTSTYFFLTTSAACFPKTNVGIGTAAPTAALQVSSGSSTYGMFRLVNSTANTSGEVSMGYFNNPSASYSGSVGSAWAHGIAAYGVGANNFGLGCAVTGIIMGITSGGNVGIGTTAPAFKLDIVGSLRCRDAVGTSGGYICLQSNPTNLPYIEWNFNSLRRMYMGYNTGSYTYISGENDYGISLGYNSAQTLNIATNGFIGIGTAAPNFQLHLYKDSPGILFTSSAYPSNPWYLFIGTSTGALFLAPNTGSATPGCNVAIGASAWAATSDLRLKKSITPLPSALDNILQLNPILFQYKTDSDSETLREGFIAQEVRSIFPSKWVVSESGMPEKQVDENGDLYNALSVSSTQLIPHLVKAIQELSATVTSSVSQIQELALQATSHATQVQELSATVTSSASQIQELSSQNTKLQAQLDAVLTRLSAAGI